jgi:hypothetical protein
VQDVRVTSFYIGPHRPPLTLATWDDLVAAVQAGSTRETQWCELKKDVPADSDKANDELAKDLASLTVDGGVLMIGVKDNASTAADVVGLAQDKVAGLSTRISQIAGGPRISPTMHVVLHQLSQPNGSGTTVLVVEVPASPSAPHMVASKYWGRSADGKRALSDDDVTRLIARRAQVSDQFLIRLAQMSSDVDWLPEQERTRGRLYVMAQPVAGWHAGELGDQLHDKHMLELIVPTLNVHRPVWATGFESLNYRQALADGLAAASRTQDDWDSRNERYLAFLQILDDGTIKYASGEAVQPWDEGTNCVTLAAVFEAVQQVALLASHLARTYLNYGGSWRLGLRVTGLRGLYPSLAYHPSRSGSGFVSYTSDVYTRDAVVTLTQLSSPSSEVVEAVARHLARGLRLDRLCFPYDHVRDLQRKLR